MIAYKVLCNIKGRLFSSFALIPFEVEYHVGQWTLPSVAGTKLFIYLNKEDAEKYIQSWGVAQELWEVEIQGEPQPFWLQYQCGQEELVSRFANNDSDSVEYHGSSSVCNAIKPLRKL